MALPIGPVLARDAADDRLPRTGCYKMVVMLDTPVFDALAANGLAIERSNRLVAAGRLRVLLTHVQEDQLGGIKDPTKAQAVASIQVEKVPTAGALWNISRWNQSKWGDEETSNQIGRAHV